MGPVKLKLRTELQNGCCEWSNGCKMVIVNGQMVAAITWDKIAPFLSMISFCSTIFMTTIHIFISGYFHLLDIYATFKTERLLI
jgi:hypothetical protein